MGIKKHRQKAIIRQAAQDFVCEVYAYLMILKEIMLALSPVLGAVLALMIAGALM